ncbi:hypothetical protein YC2023_089703 [Brassica napus]
MLTIIEKLVDVVCYIRQIVEVFGNNRNMIICTFGLLLLENQNSTIIWTKESKQTIGLKDSERRQGRERLGEAGLSLRLIVCHL